MPRWLIRGLSPKQFVFRETNLLGYRNRFCILSWFPQGALSDFGLDTDYLNLIVLGNNEVFYFTSLQIVNTLGGN